MHTIYSTTIQRIGKTLGILFIGLCLIAIILSVALPIGSRAATTEVALAPKADAVVKSSEPDRNFGTAKQISVDATPQFRSFLRFTVSGLDQVSVEQARLRLFVSDGSAATDLKVFWTDANWDEATITWNRQPAIGAKVAALAPIAMSVGSWIEVNLGRAVAGNGIYSFALTTSSSDRTAFRSRSQAEAPQLVLTLSPSTGQSTPTATMAPTKPPAPTATASPPNPPGALAAFPGAEGFGSTTPGGRGGRVIEVINLNDSGPGSLRAAVEASGPRIIVFRVAGTIALISPLRIKNPFITIAGQTAPGDGITIRDNTLNVQTHDAVIRGLRVRVGDVTGFDSTDLDGLNAENDDSGQEIYNVIFDHNSISWGIDENMSVWANTKVGKPFHDITLQWNITSEALNCSVYVNGCHSMGLLVGDHVKRVSVHHNLFAHNNKRNPEMKGDTTTEIINNVIYNWGDATIRFSGQSTGLNDPSYSNIINNYMKPGPDSPASRKPIVIDSSTDSTSQIYMVGNIGPEQLATAGDDWAFVSGDTSIRSAVPAIPASGITTQPASEAYTLVLAKAGAIAPKRDAIDQRLIADVDKGGGRIINSQAEVGGWIAVQPGTPPQDSDHDGMPDSWETDRGLNPTRDDSAEDRNADGYTNIEEYINALIPR